MIAYITHMHTREMHIGQRKASTCCSLVHLARRGSHCRRALLLAVEYVRIGAFDCGVAGVAAAHWAIAVGRMFRAVTGQQMAAWRNGSSATRWQVNAKLNVETFLPCLCVSNTTA